MNNYEQMVSFFPGPGGSSSSSTIAAPTPLRAMDVGSGPSQSQYAIQQLLTCKPLRLRELRKFRKVDLDGVCRDNGLSHSGLKAEVRERVVQYLEESCRNALLQPGPVTELRLRKLFDSVSRVQFGVSRPASTSAKSFPYVSSAYNSDAVASGTSGASGGSSSSSIGSSTGKFPSSPSIFAPGFQAAALASAAQIDQEVLRHFETNAFIRPQRTLAGPVRMRAAPHQMGAGRQTVSISFHLTSADLARIMQSAPSPRTQPGALRLMLRSARAGGAQARAAAAGAGAVEGDWQLWPAETSVHVNDVWTQLKQRRVFYQGPSKKLKGDCEPVDIAPLCHAGLNKVEIMCSDTEEYVFVIQLVQNIGVEEVLESIRQRQRESYDEGMKRVRRSFRGLPLDGSRGDGDSGKPSKRANAGNGRKGEGSDDDDDDDDDELMATSTRLPLRCPVGLVPIRVPSRGRQCGHLQCFDLQTFLSFSESNSGTSWRCGVCHNVIAPRDMVVDSYMAEVLQQLGERAADIEDVEVFPDGHWEPSSADSGNSGGGRVNGRQRNALKAAAASSGASSSGATVLLDFDDPPSPEGAFAGGATSSWARSSSRGVPAGQAPPAALSAVRGGIVDLSLSDDEDEAAPAQAAAAAAPMGGSAGGSSSGVPGRGNGLAASRVSDSDAAPRPWNVLGKRVRDASEDTGASRYKMNGKGTAAASAAAAPAAAAMPNGIRGLVSSSTAAGYYMPPPQYQYNQSQHQQHQHQQQHLDMGLTSRRAGEDRFGVSFSAAMSGVPGAARNLPSQLQEQQHQRNHHSGLAMPQPMHSAQGERDS